ncbi:MAG: methyltransferase [Planctomycetota bacterium]|nr:methyltransferase [Planctomycetota bacterium]
MSRTIALLYGLVCYAVGFGGIAYAIGFLNNVVVPKSLDVGATTALSTALLVNVGLILLFGLQHSIMPRRSFKRALARVLPVWAERSLYVFASGAALAVIYAFWQPMPEVIWSVEAPTMRAALYGIQAFGWMLLVAATFMLDHFDLFGLRQVWAHVRGRPVEPLQFKTPALYRFVRHPIQLGVLVSFWATPEMTLGHLVFASAMSVYIVIALRFFEERDLLRDFGARYASYKEEVGMLMPRFPRTAKAYAQAQAQARAG